MDAVQARLSTIFQTGRTLEQLLKTNLRDSSAPRDARSLIAESLDALRAAVAQAAAEYSGPTSPRGGDTAANAAAPEEQPLAGLHVLLVEDSPGCRSSVATSPLARDLPRGCGSAAR
jgi:hypothetical protein